MNSLLALIPRIAATSVTDDPGTPLGSAALPKLAIAKPAPRIEDLRVAPSGPSWDTTLSNYLWNKLLFDPRVLPTNPFFHSPDNLDYWGPDLVAPPTFNNPGFLPPLPPRFR